MKAFFVATLCVAALATLPTTCHAGEQEDYNDVLAMFSVPLPENSLFTPVGYECSINNVAFPTMYLYMKHYRLFFDDHLKLKAGNPRKEDGTWDWRGIWTIQKLNNASRSNATEFLFKDHENKEYATFAPTSSQVFTPIGGSKLVQGVLWNMDNFRPEGGVTTIRNSLPPSASHLHKFYLTAVVDDTNNATATRAVELDYKFAEDRSRWKITCRNH